MAKIDAWQHMYLLPNEEGGWKADLMPRRVLLEFGTHAIDLICRYFHAYPEAVSAKIAKVRQDIDADVCINVRLDFPGDRVANIVFNRMSHSPMRYFEMRLNCERAALRASLGGLARFDAGWNSEARRPKLRWSFTKGGEARLERNGKSELLINQPDAAYGLAAARHMSVLRGLFNATTLQITLWNRAAKFYRFYWRATSQPKIAERWSRFEFGANETPPFDSHCGA
ncbi:MAG: hypothetical protein U0V48_13895 [Anaerolineales bacterium]